MFAAGPESDVPRKALDITITAETKNVIREGIEASRLLLGYGDGDFNDRSMPSLVYPDYTDFVYTRLLSREVSIMQDNI